MSTIGMLLLVCLGSVVAATANRDASETHVRTTNTRIRAALEDGARRAGTMRAMIEELERSDVIVHVQPGECSCGAARSCAVFVTRSGTTRYLRITVSLRQIQNELIAQIAHELFHAVEIARAPEIVSPRALRAFYERRGRRTCGRPCGFETQEAVAAHAAVRAELQSQAPQVLR